MSSDHSTPGCGEQPHNDGHTVPTTLEFAIRDMVKREHMHETFAEKVTYVYAKDGMVSIPRSNAMYETEKDRVLIAGTDDYVFKDFIEGPLLKLFEAIISSDARIWKDMRAVHPKVLVGPTFELTKLGQQIVLCCRLYEQEWAVAYLHHVFNPPTTIMLRAMKHHACIINRHGEPGKAVTQDIALVLALDRLVRFVRRVSISWRFINAMNAHERQAQDNFDSARSLIYYYAEQCSKLLILRLDLYYKPYYEVERADQEINKFLRWLRSKACKRNLLPGYLGFEIKRENGLIRGMHWHVMVVCDGNIQCRADYLTRQLGEMWARRTEQGPGCYHNCYADHNRYMFNGLGVLELDDWEKMAGLRAALWYMTKQDCVLKATNDKVKNFWRSPMPKQAREKKGRPRVTADPLRLLRRMLGGKRSKYPPGIGPRTGPGRDNR